MIGEKVLFLKHGQTCLLTNQYLVIDTVTSTNGKNFSTLASIVIFLELLSMISA